MITVGVTVGVTVVGVLVFAVGVKVVSSYPRGRAFFLLPGVG